MPALIVCPHCREELDIPAEYHGRQVRCANCQTVFNATPEGEPPVVRRSSSRPVDDRPPWQDSPRRPARRDDDEDDRPPERSNLGVVALLALTLFTVGGCCGLFNVFAVIQVNPPMTAYTQPGGLFKVEFPAESPAGGAIGGEDDKPAGDAGWQVSASRPSANERYSVRCYELKAEWRRLTAEEALKKVAELEVPPDGPNDADRRTEMTTHNDYPALDVMDGRGQGLNGTSTVTRCVLAGKRVYVVSAQGQQNFHLFWWVRQFFLSFEITDPTATPPKRED
jgi:LSD1 subclass zinc finger protein